MVLHPLEFSECYLDSPWFRENIQQYETELERTNTQIKQLIKDAKNMLSTFKAQEKAMNSFTDRLQKFQFDCIGENLTDDEKGIAGSLKEFGLMLEEVSSEWARTIERAESQLIKPLEAFRKEHIYSFREAKKLFEKASERYYKQLEHNLNLSHKKKEQLLQESDQDVLHTRKGFHQASLQYVYKLQEVQERKKFEFVEHLLMFMQVYFNYIHQTHETACDYKDYMKELQIRLVATRERYNGMQSQTRGLMQKMTEHPDSSKSERWSRAGYLFLMEKNPISARLTSKWTKYFCMYRKENKLFQMVSLSHSSNAVSSTSKLTSSNLHTSNNGMIEPMIVKTCTRRISDIDKRFCFDLEVEDTNGRVLTFTLQAVCELDRNMWMSVMDGKEPKQSLKVYPSRQSLMALNEAGVAFVKRLISEIERRGVEHQGIYRLVGVTSKVENLLSQGLNSEMTSRLDLANVELYETNTITSALKSYLRNLPEPLMTFDLHRDFIDAAKKDFHLDRVSSVAKVVSKLPQTNHEILSMLSEHLGKVEEKHETNKMTVQNLGVCFGPTLMRDKVETVQAIIDIKFSNIIVEILIEQRSVLFRNDKQDNLVDLPSPRSQTKLTVRPSLRMKQRPRGVIYDKPPPIVGVEEEEDGKEYERKDSDDNAAPCSLQTPKTNLNENCESPHSSSCSDDGLGHMPEIGWNLGFDDLTPDSSPSATAETNLILDSVSSEPSDDTKPTQTEVKLMENSSNNSAQARRSRAGNNSTGQQTKQRVSLRRKPLSSGKMTPKQATINENNSNNIRDVKVSRPKPRTLAVANSIKEARKKFLATARDGLASPSMKGTRKKRPTPVIEYGGKFADTIHSVQGNQTVDEFEPRMRSRHIKTDFEKELTGKVGKNSSSLDVGDSGSPLAGNKDKLITPADDESEPTTESPSPPKSPVDSPQKFIANLTDADSSSSLVDVLFDNDKDCLFSTVGKTRFACQAEQANELSFAAGQLVKNITVSSDEGWIYGSIDGRYGMIPKNYVLFVEESTIS